MLPMKINYKKIHPQLAKPSSGTGSSSSGTELNPVGDIAQLCQSYIFLSLRPARVLHNVALSL